MAKIPLLLFIIFISFNKGCCYIPELHLEVNTEKDISLKNRENSYEDSFDEDTYVTNSEENVPEGPLDHEIPYSEHEQPRKIITSPNHTIPGQWAKPPPGKNVTLEFIPKKLYAQVRASHTIKRVPQEEAIEAAETEEDKENAARLREVVTNSKVATVYTEEGYEDAAYDHGGHAKGADFHEDYARKLHDELDHNGDYKKHPDESKENEKLVSQDEENSFYEDELINLKIHPKLVTQEGIAQLESEINYSNTEAEKGSEIYGAEKLTKPKEDYDNDNVNSIERRMFSRSNDLQKSENSQNNYGSSTETNKNLQLEKVNVPVYTVRPRKKPNTQTKSSQTNLEASSKKKKFTITLKNNTNFPEVTERYEETTYLQPGTGYTLVPDVPTTINYSSMFWKYFKERQNQRAALLPKIEETTSYPNTITVKSINGHGPYLKVIKNENNDSIRHPLRNIVTSDFIDNIANNPLADSGNLPKPDQKFQGTESGEIVSHTFYPDIIDSTTNSLSPDNTDYEYEINSNKGLTYSSTPISNSISPLMSNGFSSRQKKTHFEHNPFLIHFARSAKNKIPRYTVLVRPQADRNGKETRPESLNTTIGQSISKGLASNKRYPLIPTSKKHEKMLFHLRNQRKLYPVKDKVNARSTQDLIFLKPPPLSREITYTDFLPHSSTSAMDHSTVTNKSRRLEESGHKPSANFHENPVIANSAELQKNLDSILSKRFIIRPLTTTHRQELLDTFFLRPPTPFSKSEYAQYGIRQKRNARSKKKLKAVPSRNFVLVKSMHILKDNSKKRSVSIKTRKRRSNISAVDLFNESPKIVDEVIDEEIRKRFESERNVNKKKSIKTKNPNTIKNKHENIEIEIPEFEYEDKLDDSNIFDSSTTPKIIIDAGKYPFYGNNAVPSFSALKYIVNPKRVPKKTLGGMEFYNSRNYLRCDEVNPNLENVVPPEEEPVDNGGLKKDLPRLRGLGDKLDCFKAKYFDDNPLDNPLFWESQVEQPTLSQSEFNTTKFAFRILNLPSSKENYISLQVSKKPESGKLINQISKPRFRSQNRKPAINENQTHRMYKQKNLKLPQQLIADKERTIEGDSSETTPYLAEVYEDVMGTIQNLEHMYDKGRPASALTISPSLQEHPTTSDIKSIRYVTDSLRQKETGIPLIHITDEPFELHPFKIEGLVPPPEGIRISRTIPYRNKINRKMMEKDYIVNNDGRSLLGYYRTKQLKKRNIRSTYLPKSLIRKKFKRSINNLPSRLFSSRGRQIANKTLSTIPRSVRAERKSRVLNSTSTDTEASIPFNNTKKIVHTIHDRIRHSKPRKEFEKHGRFTKEPISLEIDARRQEPRYNPIMKRRKLPSIELNMLTTVPPSTSSNKTIVLLEKQADKRNQTRNEQKKAATLDTEITSKHERRVPTDLEGKLNEDQDKSDTNYQYNNKTEKDFVNQYDVFKNVSEEKPHSKLLKYLESDPPGYDEAFGKGDDSVETNQDDHSSQSDDHQEKKDLSQKSDYEYDDLSENSQEHLQDSASKPEDEKNYENQSSVKSENVKADDDRFERFNSRPLSPYENFDDDKYAELGPRIHKPAFYHPPFIVPEYETSHLGRIVHSSDSDETEESSEADKYLLPWNHDENISKEEDEETGEEEK